MPAINPVLTSANAALTVTNLGQNSTGVQQVAWVPLGTVGGSATGELGVKVVGSVYSTNGDFNIPKFDYQAFTYYGSTNNIQTRVFKTGGSGGTTVATLTYTYVAGGVADNDDIATITQT